MLLLNCTGKFFSTARCCCNLIRTTLCMLSNCTYKVICCCSLHFIMLPTLLLLFHCLVATTFIVTEGQFFIAKVLNAVDAFVFVLASLQLRCFVQSQLLLHLLRKLALVVLLQYCTNLKFNISTIIGRRHNAVFGCLCFFL